MRFSYNPAGQVTSVNRSENNNAYAWTGHYDVTRGYTANGLNQYTASGAVTPTYDARGNLTSAGSATYGYSSENMLISATGATLSYDPLLRLYQTTGSATTRLAYDGQNLIAEYNGSNGLLRRYVHGPGVDEPLVWYEGSGTTDRRWLHADERGSIVAVTDGTGSTIVVNRYDEYGIPGSGNVGRFQYTGQTWIPELGMYHYKARIYSPSLGRFLQTDPIGYGDGMNMYAYVGNDPVNFVDPTGLCYQENWTMHVYGADGTDFGPDEKEPESGSNLIDCEDEFSAIYASGGPLAFGGGANPPPNQEESEETEQQYQEDLEKCRGLADDGAKARCFESATKRDFARRNGRDLPPLITWREAVTIGSVAVFIYWAVSIGTRIVFPVRNLVPVP